MPAESQLYLSSEFQAQALAGFLARRVKPYDAETDNYDRPPFAQDIKEGKNDPIYNAHSYHTKVPPRSIIPYILHYTQPGDVVLDPFCGSGMTGVAAQLCANPPADLLSQFPDLKDRVGPRPCILNDLSPAACHIAYNYSTPVDVDALRNEFERIKAAVTDEFNWLYSTEHFEPAVGAYSLKKPEVVSRLKNPPRGTSRSSLLEGNERTWELLTRAEVESRLGYPVTTLPRDDAWGELDITKVEEWVCIPAVIQYTIWSDIYRCEGFVTVEEQTGKISTRGKNAGKPIVKAKRVARGCGGTIRLWDSTDEIEDGFVCPNCQQRWTTEQATMLRIEPASVILAFTGIVAGPKDRTRFTTVVRRRPHAAREAQRIVEINDSTIPYWFPTDRLVAGEEGNRLINVGIETVDAVYTKRNLRAIAACWSQIGVVTSPRLRAALQFLLTSVSTGLCSKLTRYNFGKRGNGAMAARLFIPHYQAEANVMKVVEGKFDDLVKYFTNIPADSDACVLNRPAQCLSQIPPNSVDFVFADPPFGRNIAYSELNILWEAWLGQVTDVEKEAITSNARKWDNGGYVAKMEAAFLEMFRVLKPGRFAMIEFNNRDPELFDGIKSAALQAGFVIRNMLLLDKDQKTFKQVQGILRGEGTLDKDVIFNIEKPSLATAHAPSGGHDLDHQVSDAVRQHLLTLPGRIQAEPTKYSDEHRTTATINSMLMNSLIPRGVSVEQLNLPFIERVCSRYFRKIGPHWYLRGEAVGGNGNGGLFEEEIAVKDDLSAIDWLRQRLRDRPMLVGEIKPLWMRATGLLSADVSQGLILEELLVENFWRDQDTNRWREPTDEERERMNDDRSTRVLHDAERYFASTLRRQTTDAERCEWIDVLFKACRQVEEGDVQSTPTLRDFDIGEGYRLITRLFQSVLRDHVSPDEYSKATKQASVASNRVAEGVRQDEAELAALRKKKERTLFD